MSDQKPAPPIGCLTDAHIDALKRDGRIVINGETILYEATSPPSLSRPLCPRCGKAMTRVSVALNIEAWECENDGRFHKYEGDTPPPPRDEAREAYREWLRNEFGSYAADRALVGDDYLGDRNMYRAFMAGRASVTP